MGRVEAIADSPFDDGLESTFTRVPRPTIAADDGFCIESEIESSPWAFGLPMTRQWCRLVPVDAEPRLAILWAIPSRLRLGVQSELAASVRSFALPMPGPLGERRPSLT